MQKRKKIPALLLTLLLMLVLAPRSILRMPDSSTTTGTGKTPASVRSSNSTPAQRAPSCRTSWSGCCVI